ncbi:MAG: hypothetical protein QOD32_75 [Pyrinomonadaceae bacterium]|jgi:hypothetical protein|nr:hypothetical protein [Pyrinomonadaceae bacterium]
MKVITNPDEREEARGRIAAILDARGEWFCAETREGVQVSLGRGEWEIAQAHDALLFSYRTERGVSRVWRVAGWEWTGERLRLNASRRMGAVRALLELVPRASVAEGVAQLSAARRAACEKLAALVSAAAGNAKIERAGLSAGVRRAEPGRYARVLLSRGGRERIAATGAVVALGAHEADAFLASALLWWMRSAEKSVRGARKLWLLVAPEMRDATAERLALLRAEMRREIELYETDEGWQKLSPVALPELEQTLAAAATRYRRPPRVELTETAARILALAPEAIDVVRARHGETLRFHGLAFARVRSLMRRERVWFGAGNAPRVLLDASTWPQLAKLIDELRAHRRADSADHRHALYASAPEAWLESLLRRDITRLDPGLRLAPLYAQFRTAAIPHNAGARPVDLLALRRDGRLVVIELKVSEDLALPLQGADYWRRISTYQRAGHIQRARLFGDAEISADAPLVYLVAPLLRFHRSFSALAGCITPEIEMYRFDINENWRAGVRVMRRGVI